MPENEQESKRELNRRRIARQRQGQMQNMPVEGERDNKSIFKKAINAEKSAKKVAKGAAQLAAGNKVSGAVNIAKGGKDLAADFLGGGFSRLGVMWFFMMALAIFKDTFDVMAMGTVWWIDWIIDIVVAGMLWAYLIIHKVSKAKIMGYITPVLEVLPYTGLLPSWTMSVIGAAVIMLKTNK